MSIILVNIFGFTKSLFTSPLFHTVFFQQSLALGDAAIGNFVQTVLGYKVKQSMRNPMLEAMSPSKFIECSIHHMKTTSKNSQLQNGSCLR